MIQKTAILLIVMVFIIISHAQNSGENGSLKKMVFEEKRIEGKIRRPQLVLIQAEQRPVFEPIILHSLGGSGDITVSVDKKIIDDIPNRGPFKFENTRITNMVP
ncbi:MAG TPA: hypothetical protein VHP36_08030 [Chitinispirillaceae bacterium]|nr:hypothetical protein [Chitinispirillaceae bacterium]